MFKSFCHSQLSLLTDLYQLTMAYGYWQAGMTQHEAVFHLFFRRLPFQGGYAIAAGLANAVELINDLQFHKTDIEFLATLKGSDQTPLFSKAFLDFLHKLRFHVDIEAVEEGTVVFPYQPIVRVKGPLIQCQLLETALLNCINFPSLIATKASRICHAAKGEPVLEFGLRRAQGFDGGITASRAAYLGGCIGTSNVLAGKLYGIPVYGTHAHSWVMSFPTETEAFSRFAEAMPNNCYLLVDTYNSLEGVKKAALIGQEMQRQGQKLLGIRLDSGDLAYLSGKARKILNAAGLYDTVIMGSNDLDEHIISSLKEQGAKINVWAVGTKLATAYDQPALDGVYKLGAIRAPQGEWQYKLKLSEQNAKISTPGLLKARRFFYKENAIADVIYDEEVGVSESCIIVDILDTTRRRKIPKTASYEELLVPIFEQGSLVYKTPSLAASRQRAQAQLALFHPAIKRFLNPHSYPVGLEKGLFELRTQLIVQAREKSQS